LLLEHAVNERELVGCRLKDHAVRVAVELEICIRIARLDHHAEPGFPGQMQHDPVLGEAVHEQRAIAAVCGVQYAALQERVAVAFDARCGAHAQAQLRIARRSVQGQVREADKVQVRPEGAEQTVAREIEAARVLADGLVADRAAEAQVPVAFRQLQQVARYVFAVVRVEPLHRDGGRQGA